MATLAKVQIIPRYVSELRTKTGYYLNYIPTEYADQAAQDGFYNTLRRDPEVARCLHLLSLMTAGERVEVEAKDPDIQDACNFVLDQIHDFVHARKSLAEKAVLFGLGIQRKYYKPRIYRGALVQAVHHVAEVDRRRLRIERDIDDKSRVYWTIWHPLIDQYMVLEDRNVNPEAPMGAGVQDYIWHNHMTEELYPYFEGVGETLYALCYVKNQAMKYWASLAESWSKPFLTVTIDTMKAAINANLGTGYMSSDDRISGILETFENCMARHIAVLDSSDKLEWHEHGASGGNIIKDLIEYIDRKIQLVILGAELTTTTAGVGSYALGAVHKAQTDTIVNYSRIRLNEVLIEDLIFDFFYRNQRALQEVGVRVPEHGEVKLTVRVEDERDFAPGQPPKSTVEGSVNGN